MTAYVIGLTGQLGSGKSTVAKILGELGATVLDADEVSRDVMRPGQPAFAAIHGEFGREILADDGTIDRAKLGQKVFGDPRALRRLEQIVWPHVIARILDVRAGLFDDSVLAVEAIKLLEAPLRRICDEVWVTVAPRETLVSRVASRGMTAVEARLRLGAQLSETEFRRFATTVLDNSAGETELRRQVEAAWRRSQERVKRRVG
ncbi:MAG TPA: dephospho-CoA kinase [Candidatus Dormibacteraeota bacterium]|nr:dephospho-CoA kinase [Candidatus Dormibacteraeota bacterium]